MFAFSTNVNDSYENSHTAEKRYTTIYVVKPTQTRALWSRAQCRSMQRSITIRLLQLLREI